MKILMVLDREFPPDIRVEKEASSLTKNGHEVCIACFTKEKKQASEKINGYRVIRKPIMELRHKTSVGALKFPFYFNFWRAFLKSIFEEEQYDVIHIHDLPLAKIGYEMKIQYKIKLVLDLHENWPAHLKITKHTNTFLGKILSSNKQWELYETEMAKKADIIIAVVEEMKNRLIKQGINEQKIKVVQNYIELNKEGDNTRNHQLNVGKEKDGKKEILLYSGGVTFHRGLQIACKGLEKALKQKNNIELWIIGEGSFLPEIKKLALELKIQAHVIFFGKIPFSELLEKMQEVDIGIIPHIKTVQTDNSSPNKLFEYMSKGLPILSSNCISVERILMEANCGKSYKHDSPSEFSEKLLEMINDKEQLKNYSINAKKAVEEKFNWDMAKESLISLYNTL